MKEIPVDVQLALISHTNNGKTTLARTLLGVDVGEVRDAAHVTLLSEAHTLLSTDHGDRLQLWDTPGFGDSVRLLKRLGTSDNPIGWFLREVFDRYRDRPFWLSQQALRTARDAADVVLYLVNASESPQDAGYLEAEMKILAWLGKPVLVLLNQVGPPRPHREEETERARWTQEMRRYPLVSEVLLLDAFTRCWVHERVFYKAIGTLLPANKAAGHVRLVSVWNNRNAARFAEAVRLTAHQLAAAARQCQIIDAESDSKLRSALKNVGLGKLGGQGKSSLQKRQEKAMQTLIERLEHDLAATTAGLLSLHDLDSGAASKINASVRENFVFRAPVDKAQAGLLGAIVSGATTGVTADLVSGGLTAGLGAILGGIVGAAAFAGAAWKFNSTTDREVPSVQFTEPFLHALVVSSVVRYLAIIHYGRGRGHFIEGEAPAFWQQHVEKAVAPHDEALLAAWQLVRADPHQAEGATRLQRLTFQIMRQTLSTLYPETAIDVDDGENRRSPEVVNTRLHSADMKKST